MMLFSLASPCPSLLSSSRKALDPDLAIVPKLSNNSSLVIPIPWSFIVSVPFSWSVAMLISRGSSPSVTSFPVINWYCSFSSASEALDITSRIKTYGGKQFPLITFKDTNKLTEINLTYWLQWVMHLNKYAVWDNTIIIDHHFMQ